VCPLKDELVTNNSEYRKQNVTIKLDRETIRKAKILAVRRSTSLSELVARRIEFIFGEEESYESAELQARMLLHGGFHLGGGRVGRDELHARNRRSERLKPAVPGFYGTTEVVPCYETSYYFCRAFNALARRCASLSCCGVICGASNLAFLGASGEPFWVARMYHM
jgi:hypothetical protein